VFSIARVLGPGEAIQDQDLVQEKVLELVLEEDLEEAKEEVLEEEEVQELDLETTRVRTSSHSPGP
jgi:hypothetical protein